MMDCPEYKISKKFKKEISDLIEDGAARHEMTAEVEFVRDFRVEVAFGSEGYTVLHGTIHLPHGAWDTDEDLDPCNSREDAAVAAVLSCAADMARVRWERWDKKHGWKATRAYCS